MVMVVVLAVTMGPLMGLGATPARPNPSDTFEAKVFVEYKSGTGSSDKGEGEWGRNQGANQAVIFLRFEPKFNYYQLDRYDIGKQFIITSANISQCNVTETSSVTLPPIWGWISSANYIGNKTFHDHLIYLWTSNVGGVEFAIGVGSDPTIPLFFGMKTSLHEEAFEFAEFKPVAPPSRVFDIPKECPSSSPFKKQ